ncbi:NapC/NirT family cytochrome c [Neobacillus cucumis]|uniref:NapC/NirT family cytochrome c n=1 Tax=Neobacillus cucumis TaxID=1740721 RepID=UPI0028536863|nr:NapC/NirT family cytochrome c [Neobacillus cucumis]MDR4949457.1 cytochrome c3 family protein [Neobacillus cucumis]
MEEEKETRPAPPRNHLKLIKIMTLTVLFLALFFALGTFGLEASSSSSFCSSCHEMKPEYYTWKASSHSEVECVSCHVQPGAKNIAKDKAEGITKVVEKETNSYTAPIQMPKDIPNSACEQCHDMSKRQVTSSGDLIIPHDKHLAKDIKCTQCHSGVAHGKISERNVTFKSDYDKWDTSLGKSMMSDVTFTRPKMETCMECHEAREISTECKTCHTGGMLPKSHKQSSFKTSDHGELANKDIDKCNKCHQYMSDEEIQGLQSVSPTQQFLSTGTITKKSISAEDYAKENTFCKDCHSTRPASHVKGFVNLHGKLAEQNKEKCLTCHDYQKTGFNKTSNVTCNSCHPASHAEKNYKEGHPIPLSATQKPVAMCYTCHYKPKCTSCHKE